MRVYQTEDLQERMPFATAVCLGVFDGVHVGHQQLIAETITIAKKNDLQALVHTYDPLPQSVLRPEKNMPELTNLSERIELIAQQGIDLVAVSQFTPEMQHQTGRQFFEEILLNKLHTKHLVIGFNHRFGYQGDTDAAKLAAMCKEAGIEITVLPAVRTKDGDLISSTAIRAAILLEDWALVKEMLGREPSKTMIDNMTKLLKPKQIVQINGGNQ